MSLIVYDNEIKSKCNMLTLVLSSHIIERFMQIFVFFKISPWLMLSAS